MLFKREWAAFGGDPFQKQASSMAAGMVPNVQPLHMQHMLEQNIKQPNTSNQPKTKRKPVSLSHPELVRCRRNWLEKKRMHAKQEAIQSMRKTVRELEQRLEALCAFSDSVRLINAPTDHQNQDQLQNQSCMSQVVPRSSNSSTRNASLYALVQEIHALIRENACLRDLIEQQVHFQNMVRMVVETTTLGSTISIPTVPSDRFGKFCYIPFTVDECYALIRKDLALYVAKRPDFDNPEINQVLPFGWRGRVYFENANLCRVHMTKEWPGDPKTNCNTMWRSGSKESDPRHVYWEQHRMEMLQLVTEDMKIMRRRVFWQGWASWSVFLLYRTRLDDSYLIGIVPLPLWGNGNPVGIGDPYGRCFLGDRDTLAIRPLHHLYEPVLKENGEIHTRVRRWGSSFCDHTLFMTLFEQCAVDTILRFERLVLLPVVTNLIEESTHSSTEREEDAMLHDI